MRRGEAPAPLEREPVLTKDRREKELQKKQPATPPRIEESESPLLQLRIPSS